MQLSFIRNTPLAKCSVLKKCLQDAFLNLSFLDLVTSSVCCRYESQCRSCLQERLLERSLCHVTA